VFSGLAHELVISLPAAAGYGLPTGYFLLQWLGLIVEKSSYGRRLGLNRAWTGRLFAALIVVGPIGILFHVPFVNRVIVPFLVTTNAL
jgi:alginate O-acetyltransferase complex protein AlgI